ncbi:unnamed protein product [Rhodiola kirilowii]
MVSAKLSCEASLSVDDQCFLLSFIMGHYFGPDINLRRPKKSALQRVQEGLPPYTHEQLAGSQMKTTELERIYYYIVRKADPLVVVSLHSFHQFLQGHFQTSKQVPKSVYPQFPELFPTRLHPHALSESQQKVIENVVFINNPELNYIKAEDIKRFKKLTGMESLSLSREEAKIYTAALGTGFCGGSVQESNAKHDPPPVILHRPKKTRRVNDRTISKHLDLISPTGKAPCAGMTFASVGPSVTDVETRYENELMPAMVYLPSQPTIVELENIVAATRSGFALTGSAANGRVGATVGRMDIGECNDSYLFRVSLPGVKRDEREFSCEVESDGKVLIKGVTTTGDKTMCRHSQVFQMKTQNLCPPGHFSILFQLPGPVDPEHFSGRFSIDGIFEGIIKKERQQD